MLDDCVRILLKASGLSRDDAIRADYFDPLGSSHAKRLQALSKMTATQLVEVNTVSIMLAQHSAAFLVC